MPPPPAGTAGLGLRPSAGPPPAALQRIPRSPFPSPSCSRLTMREGGGGLGEGKSRNCGARTLTVVRTTGHAHSPIPALCEGPPAQSHCSLPVGVLSLSWTGCPSPIPTSDTSPAPHRGRSPPTSAWRPALIHPSGIPGALSPAHSCLAPRPDPRMFPAPPTPAWRHAHFRQAARPSQGCGPWDVYGPGAAKR